MPFGIWELAAMTALSATPVEGRPPLAPKPDVELSILDQTKSDDRRVRERALTEGDAQEYVQRLDHISVTRAVQKQVKQRLMKTKELRSGAYRHRLLDAIRTNDKDQVEAVLADAIPGAIGSLQTMWNPLESVVRSNRPDILACLHRAGFSFTRIRPEDEYSPVLLAAKSGHVATLQKMAELEPSSMMTETRVGTPLIVAALHGRDEAVKYLLSRGVPVINSNPPLSQRVEQNGYHDIARLIAAHERPATPTS